MESYFLVYFYSINKYGKAGVRNKLIVLYNLTFASSLLLKKKLPSKFTLFVKSFFVLNY